MSDTEGMVRLMDHAAGLMQTAMGSTIKVHGVTYEIPKAVVAALAFGEATLRMVAASVAPERSSAVTDLRAGYETWAEERDDAAPLSRSEIESVARFLIGAE